MKRALVLGGAMATACVVVACSPFDPVEPPPPAPPLAEGGPEGGPDASSPDASPPASACGGMKRPIVFFAPTISDPPNDTLQENGGVVQRREQSGLQVVASGTPPNATGAGNGIRALARWERQVAGARGVDVDFKLRATYASTQAVYVEAGCELAVVGVGGVKSTLLLLLLPDRIELGGRHPTDGGANQPFRPEVRVAEGGFPLLDTERTFNLHLDLAMGVSKARATMIGGRTGAGSLNTPLPIVAVQLSCGIVYADNAAASEVLQVETREASVTVCD